MKRAVTASDFQNSESKLFGSAWASFPIVVILFLLSYVGFPSPVDISVVLNPGSNLALIFIDRCNFTKMYNSSILIFLLDCRSRNEY